jgi:hypothetical protein
MINELIKIANIMDKKGLKKEADHLDQMIKKIAGRGGRGWTGGRSRHGRRSERAKKEEFDESHKGQERAFSKENIPEDMLKQVMEQAADAQKRRQGLSAERREEFAREPEEERARKMKLRNDDEILRSIHEQRLKHPDSPSYGDDPELPPRAPGDLEGRLGEVERSFSKIEERLIRIENMLMNLEGMWK